MPERNDQNLDTSTYQPEDTTNLLEHQIDLPPAVQRFVSNVDALVDERLTSDEIEARLERVRQQVERSTLASRESDHQNPNWRSFARELAQYGYCTVEIWLRVVLVWIRANAAIGDQRVDLTEGDINELAQETVARALNSFRNEVQRSGQSFPENATEVKTTFLIQCIRQLPRAYRSTLLKTGRLPDRLEELMGQPVEVLAVRRLRYCFINWRDHTAGLLRAWDYTDEESNEIISMTLHVLDLAVARYAELRDPYATDSTHGHQAVER